MNFEKGQLNIMCSKDSIRLMQKEHRCGTSMPRRSRLSFVDNLFLIALPIQTDTLGRKFFDHRLFQSILRCLLSDAEVWELTLHELLYANKYANLTDNLSLDSGIQVRISSSWSLTKGIDSILLIAIGAKFEASFSSCHSLV